MTARQRVLVISLIALILLGNGINGYISRQNALRFLATVGASELQDGVREDSPDQLSSDHQLLVVTKAFNADGTEHDFSQCDLLHINWATAEELQQLPGIGPVLAQRIIEVRSEALFVEFEDILAVPGIGQKKLERIIPLVCLAVPHVEE